MDTAPIITAHDLVSATALRAAQRGYDAPNRADDQSARERHRARLATAVAAAAPAVAAQVLEPLMSYLDGCAIGHFAIASAVHQEHGDTARYREHRSIAQAYDLAAELLAHHHATFSGRNPSVVSALHGGER